MPYTLSHAIVSLPISKLFKGKIPVASIFVGSMSPDFPYQVALAPVGAPGHSFSGVFIYCLLPSLIILGLWYRWLEKPTMHFLCLPFRKRVFNRWSYVFIVLGVLIGAFVHVLWDATSHPNGFFVENSEILKLDVLSLPLFKWNQYISGVMGLALLVLWYASLRLNKKSEPYRGHLALGFSLYAISILIFVIAANLIHDSRDLHQFAVHSAVGVLSGAAVGTCIYSLIVNLRQQSIRDTDAL